MKLSATSFMFSAVFLLNLAACGGGGSSSEKETPDDQNLSERNFRTAYTFHTKIVRGSLQEVQPLSLSQPLSDTAQDAYLISTLDQAKAFNDALSPADRAGFNDLQTAVYFLIAASSCPDGSASAASEQADEQVSIKLNRSASTGNALCSQPGAKRFHVFKAAKLHSPETLFETIADMPESTAADSQAGTVIIEDSTTWSDYWADRYSQWTTPPALPSIDFSQNTVIGVKIGPRSSGCYSVGIDRIYASSDESIVEFTEWTPPSGAICTQAITYPVHFVTVAKSLSFRFVGTKQEFMLP